MSFLVALNQNLAYLSGVHDLRRSTAHIDANACRGPIAGRPGGSLARKLPLHVQLVHPPPAICQVADGTRRTSALTCAIAAENRTAPRHLTFSKSTEQPSKVPHGVSTVCGTVGSQFTACSISSCRGPIISTLGKAFVETVALSVLCSKEPVRSGSRSL